MPLKVVAGIAAHYLLLLLWLVPAFPLMGNALRRHGDIEDFLAGAFLLLVLITGMLVQGLALILRRLWTYILYKLWSYFFAIPITAAWIAHAILLDWSEAEASVWYYFVLSCATLPGAAFANYANHRLVHRMER